MIYLDTSVALAQLLAEDRAPPPSLWGEPLIASRLLEYEIWTRLNARRLGRSHGEEARALIQRVALIELGPPVLERALEPFPVPVAVRSRAGLGATWSPKRAPGSGKTQLPNRIAQTVHQIAH